MNASSVATSSLGAQLYETVVAYSQWSTHRTGTTDDAATIAWFRSIVENDGAHVDVDAWVFPQWTATWEAVLDGAVIESLPIFYETIGSFDNTTVDVVATEHPTGLLTVKNQRVVAEVPRRDRATLQVAGEHQARLCDVHAHISDARIVDGHSANVRAAYGCDFGEVDVLLATPLSGWFRCASERGTGIAVTKWLAQQLAQRGVRVGVLATSGHELFNLGLEHHLSTVATKPVAVIHIGASIAARAPSDSVAPLVFSDSLYAITNRSAGGRALESLGFQRRVSGPDPKQWIGEGTRWCTENVPLLSVAGMSHWFHTPQDTPDIATHPELLARVADALLVETLDLLDASRELPRSEGSSGEPRPTSPQPRG